MREVMRFFEQNRELGLVGMLVLILLVLFAPIPPALLDLAIISNIGLSLAILLLTLYVAKPVDFSTFPSLLLLATLFRLAINIASTRLILTDAEAGQVIAAIGSFSISGNFVVGLVVFFILVIVQFIVVTSGAQRVSEVAARFTLDSMPGQQMSIDADLNMGLIDQAEAVRRRRMLEQEAAFYGSMDGASKFVKGDAVASIIIVLINIVAGCIIGVASLGMSWSESIQTFSLLTVGDGIATQIPALIIAVATGIIVTRSSADRDLTTELVAQLMSAPRALVAVCIILAGLLLLPGMPKWPLVLIGGCLVALMFHQRRLAQKPKALSAEGEDVKDATLHTRSERFPAIAIHFGGALSAHWTNSGPIILERIAQLRDAQERETGLAFPAVSLSDGNQLGTNEYEIRLFGTRHASGTLFPDRVLAVRSANLPATATLGGLPDREPAFGLHGEWVAPPPPVGDGRLPDGWTAVDPLSLLVTHLGEVVRREVATLLTRATTVKLLDGVRQSQPGLVEELIPTLLTVSDVQKVLHLLLEEGVPVGNLELIIEHLVDLARTEKDVVNLTEAVRQRLAFTICNALRGRHDDLAVLSLRPRLEHQIQTSMSTVGRRSAMPLDLQLASYLIEQLMEWSRRMQSAGRTPVLLCVAENRRMLRALVARDLPKLAIISTLEIPHTVTISGFGYIEPLAPAGGAAGSMSVADAGGQGNMRAAPGDMQPHGAGTGR